MWPGKQSRAPDALGTGLIRAKLAPGRGSASTRTVASIAERLHDGARSMTDAGVYGVADR